MQTIQERIVKSSPLNKLSSQNTSKTNNNEIDPLQFQKTYGIGNITQEQADNLDLFHKIDRLTFNQCLETAQSSGTLCGSNTKFCPYFGFKIDTTLDGSGNSDIKGVCYVGGFKNDEQRFVQDDKIDETMQIASPVFLTPLEGEDLREREKMAMEEMRKRLVEQRKTAIANINQQLEETDVYLRALREEKPFAVVNEDMKKEKEAVREKQLNEKMESKITNVQNKNQTLERLSEQQKLNVLNSQKEIVKKSMEVGSLDSILNTIREKITYNNNLYSFNDRIGFYLKIALAIAIIIMFGVFIYYSIVITKIPTNS